MCRNYQPEIVSSILPQKSDMWMWLIFSKGRKTTGNFSVSDYEKFINGVHDAVMVSNVCGFDQVSKIILYAPNCLDFWHQAKTVQKNWLKLVLCLQILNLDWTTLWNHLNSLPNGHSGVRMVLDLFWTSKPGKCSQKSPKQNSPLILLQNFGTPIVFWKSQFFGSF